MFDITAVMAECRAYIEAIDDYQIEVPGKIVETAPNELTHFLSKESIKVPLIEFLYSCKAELEKGELHLIQFLRSRRTFWEASQGHTINKLNNMIERMRGEDLIRAKDQKDRFFRFFHHNYAIIDLIRARLMGLPLDDSLQFKLKQAGVEWIINGAQLPINVSSTADQTFYNSKQVVQNNSTQRSLLFITPKARQALYNDLLEYVKCDEDGNHLELHALIFDQQAPSTPIVVTCSVKAFGETFFETGAVPEGGAEKLSQQLSNLFVRNTSNGLANFEASYLVEKLRPNKKTK